MTGTVQFYLFMRPAYWKGWTWSTFRFSSELWAWGGCDFLPALPAEVKNSLRPYICQIQIWLLSGFIPWKSVIWAWKNRIWPWKYREIRETYMQQFALIWKQFLLMNWCSIWTGLGLVRICGAMSLQDLPFPLVQLNCEKLPIVQKTLKLSKAEAISVLTRVLGARPEETWLT